MKISKIFKSRSEEVPFEIPAGRMKRLRNSFQRRLCDSLEDVFHRACIEADTRTANGLYTVLEDMYTRRTANRGSERRINDEAIAKLRTALDRCQEIGEREKQDAPAMPTRTEWLGKPEAPRPA